MAHILLNESEYTIVPPRMETLNIVEDNDNAATKATKTTENKQKELDYQIAREEYKKEEQVYKRNKEKLCRYPKENCTPMMLTKLETVNDYNAKGLNDPVWLLATIKNK